MRKELIFGGLFAVLVAVSLVQAVTVMSLSEKMESSITGAVTASETQDAAPQQNAQTAQPIAKPIKSLNELEGMVGGC